MVWIIAKYLIVIKFILHKKKNSDLLNDFLSQPKIPNIIDSTDNNNNKLNFNNIHSSNNKSSNNPNFTNQSQSSSLDSYAKYNSMNSLEINNQDMSIARQYSHTKVPVYMNTDSNDMSTPMSRSRSSSVNNTTNLSDQAISTAEQKRRCNIQCGFDRLQTLVPSLKDAKNSKASKATMLKKTSEYVKELKTAREKRMYDLTKYQREIEELSNQVTECQIQLPANGVSVTGKLNKTEIFEKKLKAYIQEKTVENWKFYLFSFIIRPLFENFITTLNTSSKENMERTFYQWQEKYCNLIQLRPIVTNYLRQISKSTSILSDASKVPDECYISALTKI